MAVQPRTAARVLLVAAVLAAGTALVIATIGAVGDGPALPLMIVAVMEIGIAGVALALRRQLLRQYPADDDAADDEAPNVPRP